MPLRVCLCMIPGIEKYPSLQRAYEQELAQARSSGCGRCNQTRLLLKYKKLIRERDKFHK
jgi:hypothetical protein